MSIASTAAVVVILSASIAAADPNEPRADASALPVWFAVVSEDCQRYATIPADAGDELGWNQLLSLATCLQDASIPHLEARADFAKLVANLDDALTPSATLNLYAIQHGPDTVRLRAAYQIGMAYVALITRARAALVASSVERHAELEARLQPARHAAKLAFAAIDQVAAEAPQIVRDPVTAGMVRSARAVLPIFRDADDRDDHTTTASLPSR